MSAAAELAAAGIAQSAAVLANEIVAFVLATREAENLPLTLSAALCIALIEVIERGAKEDKRGRLEAAIAMLREVADTLGWRTQ